MGVLIHKVAEEKLHKRMASQNKLRHCPASQTLAYTVIFITAPYSPARPGEVLQFGAKCMCTRTSQMKYTLQGCAYDCAHTLTYT